MNGWTIGFSISALIVSCLSWFFRPIITNTINRENEKNKNIREERISLNNLKEKWLDYYRTAIRNYIESCELLMTCNKERNAYSDRSSERDATIELIKFNTRNESNKAIALIQSYKTNISLLFSNDSESLKLIDPILEELKDYADKIMLKEYVNTLNNLKTESKIILEQRWASIENGLKFTEILG